MLAVPSVVGAPNPENPPGFFTNMPEVGVGIPNSASDGSVAALGSAYLPVYPGNFNIGLLETAWYGGMGGQDGLNGLSFLARGGDPYPS